MRLKLRLALRLGWRDRGVNLNAVVVEAVGKEHWDRIHDPREAMVGGLAHSGRVIFAAGAVMVAVSVRSQPIWDWESLVMTDLLLEVEKASLKSDIPQFAPGDSIRVYVKVREGEKERIQVFTGVVIARRAGGARETFTVRKISGGVGVDSPIIDRIEVERRGAVRRAKLYYLRERKGKAARIDEKQTDQS